MFKSLSSNKFGRAACLIAVASLVAAVSGCTDEEVDATLDGVIAGIEIVAIANGAQCVGEERTVCQDSPDYFGRIERVCRTQYDSCAELSSVSVSRMAASSDAVVDGGMAKIGSATAKVNDVAVAKAFGLRFDSAAKILDAIKAARAGDRAALASIGLADADLEAIGMGSLPSDAGIDSMARALNQSPEVVKSMLARVVNAQQQRVAQQRAAEQVAAAQEAGGP